MDPDEYVNFGGKLIVPARVNNDKKYIFKFYQRETKLDAEAAALAGWSPEDKSRPYDNKYNYGSFFGEDAKDFEVNTYITLNIVCLFSF